MDFRVGPIYSPGRNVSSFRAWVSCGPNPSLKSSFLFPVAPWRLSSTLPTTATLPLTSKMSSHYWWGRASCSCRASKMPAAHSSENGEVMWCGGPGLWWGAWPFHFWNPCQFSESLGHLVLWREWAGKVLCRNDLSWNQYQAVPSPLGWTFEEHDLWTPDCTLPWPDLYLFFWSSLSNLTSCLFSWLFPLNWLIRCFLTVPQTSPSLFRFFPLLLFLDLCFPLTV